MRANCCAGSAFDEATASMMASRSGAVVLCGRCMPPLPRARGVKEGVRAPGLAAGLSGVSAAWTPHSQSLVHQAR